MADGLKNRAGEFVRTPKRGSDRWRYRAAMDVPFVEIFFALVCGACVVMSIRTGHWFATPFASLFTFGFAYVAWLLGAEAFGRRRRDLAPALSSVAEAVPTSGTRAKGEATALTDVAA